MSYYRTCPRCGGNLDPGEVCDCGKEKAVLGVTSTQDGKAEQNYTPVSAPMISSIKEEVNSVEGN